MRKLKKLVAAVMTSAMVLGMSFATFAADFSFGMTATAEVGSGKATVAVTADKVDLNATVLKFEYDKEVLSNPTVDLTKIPSLNSTIANTGTAGEIYLAMAGLESLVQNDVVSITFEVATDISEEDLKAALASVKLLPQDVNDADGNQVAGEGFLLDADGNLSSEAVAPVTLAEGSIDITTPATEDPGKSEDPGKTEDPGKSEDPAKSETPGQTETPAKSDAPTPTTKPSEQPAKASTAPTGTGTSPKTADTASVVVPVVALCAAAAVLVVVSKKRVEE